jgi:hypothetical protein
MVAALYIDRRGPYPRIAAGWQHAPDGSAAKHAKGRAIDCWDAARDARLYAGPHPVVAHPPCGPWGRLRHLYKGDEHDCATRAVEQVRAFGGVLEHPAGSLLWMHGPTCPGTASGAHCEHAADGDLCCKCGWEHLPLPEYAEDAFGGYTVEANQCGWEHLPLPEYAEDAFGGYTVEVNQCEWGHVARKRTWLYLVGVPREVLEAPPFPGR